VLLLALAVAAPLPAVAPSEAQAAAFDPSGRKKGGKGGTKGGGGTKGTKTPKKPDSDGKKKPVTADDLVQRYTKIVLDQPGDVQALQKLVQHYRERDGNLKKALTEFEAKVAAADAQAWSAKVALAGLYRFAGRGDDAVKTYLEVVKDRPKEAGPLMALASLEVERKDRAAAKGHYDQALALVKTAGEIDQLRLTLMKLSLEMKEYEAAKKYHDDRVKASGNAFFVKGELGRELMAMGQYERAETEFRELVKFAQGDNRVLPQALHQLGEALVKAKKYEEAMQQLKKGLSIAGQDAGIRNQILDTMSGAYREQNKLAELIALIEADKPSDFQRLSRLGALHEELGQFDKAIASYRKALSADSKNIDVRHRLVKLLEINGELEKAVSEYEALIKAAPTNHQYVFDFSSVLIQRGERAKALKLLTDLESRISDDADALVDLADRYDDLEEKDKALKALQKAAQLGLNEEHLEKLGDRYFVAGDKKKALETWARIKTVMPNKAKAAVKLGEVYLQHDMIVEGLASIREAITLEPKNGHHRMALAMALQQAGMQGTAAYYAEAVTVLEKLLEEAAGDTSLAIHEPNARKRLIDIWAATKELPQKIAPLQAKFAGTPPDVLSGKLLAAAHERLGQLAEAESTLRKLVEVAPGSLDAYGQLVAVLKRQGKLADTLPVYEKWVEASTVQQAFVLYQQMSQIAAELYRDDDAIKYAAKAVSLRSENAEGHRQLAEMYRRRQDIPSAIAEFRIAISQNKSLYAAYFDLAEILLSISEVEEADRLLRHVMRSASRDEDLVAKAARLSVQINLGKGSLESLEKDLLPLSIANPQKPLYRRLLVELYGSMTFPLVQKLRSKARTEAEATAARTELSRIGARAVKPLLDALGDDRESQQKIAIEVLAYVENKGAGPALFNYATGAAEKSLRVRAMVACGALRSVDLLPKYEQLLAPKDGKELVPLSDPLALAAAWGVARLGDKKAEPLLNKLVSSTANDVRALAALGLGLGKEKKNAGTLVQLVKSADTSPVVQAAALESLTELGSLASLDRATLRSAAESADPVLRRSAMLALARSGTKAEVAQPGGVGEVVASSVFSTQSDVRDAAVTAASILGGATPKRTAEPLAVPDGPILVTSAIQSFEPEALSATDRAKTLVAFAPTLQRVAVAALATSPERGRAVADALLAVRQVGGLPPFVRAGDALADDLRAQARAVSDDIVAAAVPSLVSLVRHPSIDVRTRAAELLADRPEDAAQKAAADALLDPEESVRRAVLSALGRVGSEVTSAAVATVLETSESWSLRVRAAEALGRLGRMVPAAAKAGVVAKLTNVGKADPFALVREAALRAAHETDPALAKPALEMASRDDVEGRVRSVALALLAPPK
jgi:tetratricopeptide (TPR) repeat protein/HEAT repeat protein